MVPEPSPARSPEGPAQPQAPECWICEKPADPEDWVETLGRFMCPLCMEQTLEAQP